MQATEYGPTPEARFGRGLRFLRTYHRQTTDEWKVTCHTDY